MTDVIDVAAVEDNRMFADGLRAWAGTQPDIRLVSVAATAEELLRTAAGRRFVVLLNSALRTGADPADSVRRLVDAGHRVVVIDGSVDLTMVARTLSAGAHGYLTHNHDMAALAATVRAIALGGTAWSLGPTMARGAGRVDGAAAAVRAGTRGADGVRLGADPRVDRPEPGDQPGDRKDLPQAGQGQVPRSGAARLHQARPCRTGPRRLLIRNRPARGTRRQVLTDCPGACPGPGGGC